MKKKVTLSNSVLICLILLIIAPNVIAATYTCGLNVGDEFIFETLQLDKNFWETYGSSTISYEEVLTQREKIKIKSVYYFETNEKYDIVIQIWESIKGNETFDVNPDHTSTLYAYTDPTKGMSDEFLVMLLPVDLYLKEMVENIPESPGTEYSVEGNSLKVKSSDYVGDMSFVYTYSAISGFLINMKYLDENDAVLYEKGVKSGIIPGYDIPILSGVAISTIICLVYILKKKRL